MASIKFHLLSLFSIFTRRVYWSEAPSTRHTSVHKRADLQTSSPIKIIALICNLISTLCITSRDSLGIANGRLNADVQAVAVAPAIHLKRVRVATVHGISSLAVRPSNLTLVSQ